MSGNPVTLKTSSASADATPKTESGPKTSDEIVSDVISLFREPTWQKAFRLLVEGKVRVDYVSESGYLVNAHVTGDHAEYRVDHGMTREGLWTCSCPAYGDCSHLRAVQRVVR